MTYLAPCNGCQRTMSCVHDREGFSYCRQCYKARPMASCDGCARFMKYTSPEPPALCYRCAQSEQWKGQPCHRCGTTVHEKGAFCDGHVYCKGCRHHAIPKRWCHYCQALKPRVYRRDALGLDQPACDGCASAHRARCGVCRQLRLLPGFVQGRPACEGCVERGTLLDGVCSQCGHHDKAPDSPQCLGCASLRRAHAVREKAVATLQQPWMQALFLAFTDDAGIERVPAQVVTLMKRNIAGFQLLDQQLADAEALTVTAVLEAMVSDTTNRRFRVIKHYLGATRGLDFDGEEARVFHYQQKLARVVATAATPWIATELQAFHASMLMRRKKMLDAGRTRGALPMTYDSMLLAIKYARWMLNASHELGATSAHSVTQTMVDAYVAAHPKTFQTLAAVVRHLNRNRQRFQPLELPTKAPVRSSIHLRVSHQQRSELVRIWLAADEGMTLRNSCVALLCMFYLQKPYQVLALRRRDLQRDGTSVSIDFGQGPEEIDVDIAAVLVRWLDAWHHHSRFRALAQNDFLFPGTRPDRGYSNVAFNNWLRSAHGLGARELFGTALHGLIEAGLTDPSAMIRVYGIRPATALRYWRDAGADLSTFLFKEAIEAMRENGDFDVN